MAEKVKDCPFCDLPENPPSPVNVCQAVGDGQTFLTPALGMLAEGNFLWVTREHVTSFTALGRQALEALEIEIQPYEARLSKVFGDYFRIEHGSDNLTFF